VVGVGNILPVTVLAAGGIRIGERLLEANGHSLAVGAPAYACIRPERVTLVRENHQAPSLKNVLEGDIVDVKSDGGNVELLFRALPPRLLPDSPFDLQIALPVYIYERLDLAHKQHWFVSIKPEQIHFVT
jgi:ABC-type molybdate transport system ATPase subunit